MGPTAVNPFEGQFAAILVSPEEQSSAVLKNANVGIGTVAPNSDVTISFYARGAGVNGGVAIAEFFSELALAKVTGHRDLADGGTSSTEILGGGPLTLDPNPNVWTFFEFTTTTGSDVSGGVTLQFAAITGGDHGSFSALFIDAISIDVADAVIPVPAAAWLFASALGLLVGTNRRRIAG